MSPTVRGLVVSLLVGGSLTGCSLGSSDTLDTDKAAAKIAEGLTKDLGGTVTVACPDDVEVEPGGTFACEATTPEGEKATIAVVQQDDEGTIRYSVR
jgi:hypothetical protein